MVGCKMERDEHPCPLLDTGGKEKVKGGHALFSQIA